MPPCNILNFKKKVTGDNFKDTRQVVEPPDTSFGHKFAEDILFFLVEDFDNFEPYHLTPDHKP